MLPTVVSNGRPGGRDPKLLVSVAGGLKLAHGNRGAPLLRSLAFKVSCRQAVVGGASAPRVTKKPAARGAGRPAYRWFTRSPRGKAHNLQSRVGPRPGAAA